MYVINPDKLNQDNLLYLDDEYIVQRLLDDGIMYLSIQQHDGKEVWIFAKTQQLNSKLEKYKEESK